MGDMEVISTYPEIQESQSASLTSIHIENSQSMPVDNTVVSISEPTGNTSCFNVLVYLFVCFLKLIWYLLFWTVLIVLTVVLFVLIVSILVSVVCVSFVFLLASFLVLRFSQFIKRGEDYDKVTQVKAVVEWFMVLDSILIVFVIWIVSEYNVRAKSHQLFKFKVSIDWSYIFVMKIYATFAVRSFLLWIIEKCMPRMTLEHNESGLKVIQATCDIVDCLCFLYIGSVIMDYFPQSKILGHPTRKWMEVTIFLLSGWNLIALSTHLIVFLLHVYVMWYLKHVHDGRGSHRYLLFERLLSVQTLVYYGNGMKRGFNFMLSSLLLFLVWVFYFGPHLTRTVWVFGTQTCTILLVLSFLWLLKDSVLLSWEAKAVYNRLISKILDARKSLYFLGILGRHSHDILKLRYGVAGEIPVLYFLANNVARVNAYYQDKHDPDDDHLDDDDQLQPKLSNKKRARVRHDLLFPKNKTFTLFNVQQVAQYFLTAANGLLVETYISDLLGDLKADGDNRYYLKKLIIRQNNAMPESSSECVQDWLNFGNLLDLDPSTDVCYIKVKTWIEKSHNKCLFLANTLRSAKKVVDCLNNIISVLISHLLYYVWLILTGLADTKVLVLIASPLLAATFIFGDTCKSLFQGIIYVYVVHPLDVGDLCVIEEKMMEVKSIGIWTTTFSEIDKVGTHEKVIYPNSELAMKKIVNHKTEFDWNDSVEFNVEHLDEQQIKELQKQIEDFLDAGNDESMLGSHSVAVLSIGKEIKIVVRFRHNKRNVDMTYFECVKEKDSLRSAFILIVQNLAKNKRE